VRNTRTVMMARIVPATASVSSPSQRCKSLMA
jgi:hypothetical protein